MKLNGVNKIFIAIAVLLVAAIAWKRYNYNAGGRYYYDAMACAPETFPVYVRELYFITGNGDHVSFDTEDVNHFNSYWKMFDVFPESNQAELLPEKMVLKYASFREGSFYSDTIQLPEEKIKAAFDESLKNNKGTDIYYLGQQKKGLCFMAGIANNGNIIVWLRDEGGEKEMMRTKLAAKTPQPTDTYFGQDMSPKAYLEDRFSFLSDSIKTIIRSGFDANANYIDSATNY